MVTCQSSELGWEVTVELPADFLSLGSGSVIILVLQSIYLYFGSYTYITEHILVFRILYLYYRAYTCLTDLILVLQILCLYYET